MPRNRICEHPRWLDIAASLLADQNPSLYLDRAPLYLNLHPYLSFRLPYRNNTAGRSKSAIYAEVVHRKYRERITEER